jgi:hypothetical protein
MTTKTIPQTSAQRLAEPEIFCLTFIMRPSRSA